MIAILSDIHSNYEALQAVLEDMHEYSIDKIYILGDIIGYGPNPNECTKQTMALSASVIKGNHERALTFPSFLDSFNNMAKKSILWTREQLEPENLSYLTRLPEYLIEKPFSFVHGSIDDPDKYLLKSPDILEDLKKMKNRGLKIEFFGHTHIRMFFEEDKKPLIPKNDWYQLSTDKIYLINPGSVGQPRDRSPQASYLLFNPENYKMLYRKIPYNIELTIEKMKDLNFPSMIYDRLKLGI